MKRAKMMAMVATVVAWTLVGLTASYAEDVVLVTTWRLERDAAFYRAVDDYIAVLEDTEGLEAGYYELDFLEYESDYGYTIRRWDTFRDNLETLVDETGASYIILLGGPLVVPRPNPQMPRLADGCAAEAGGYHPLQSDAFYIDFDGDDIVEPGLSIGRLADVGYASSGVVEGLRTAMALHEAGGFDLSNQTRFMHHTIEGAHTTPPFGDDAACPWWGRQEFVRLMSTSGYIRIEGHGSPTSFASNDHVSTLRLSEGTLDDIDLATYHPVIMSLGACDTAQLYDDEPSFGTEFTARGAGAFVGRTRELGSHPYVVDNFPLDIEGGARIGDALFQRIREACVDATRCLQKETAINFCLYGDPTLRRAMPVGEDPIEVGPPVTGGFLPDWVNAEDLEGPQPHEYGWLEIREAPARGPVTTYYRIILDSDDEASEDTGWVSSDMTGRLPLYMHLDPSLNGRHGVVLYYSASGPSNREHVHISEMTYDFTAPSVGLTIDGFPVIYREGLVGSVEASRDARIVISARDDLSDVWSIQYRIDSGTWQRAYDVNTLEVDLHSTSRATVYLTYRAVDNAGNTRERALRIVREPGIAPPPETVFDLDFIKEPPRPIEKLPPALKDELPLDLPVPPTFEMKMPEEAYAKKQAVPVISDKDTTMIYKCETPFMESDVLLKTCYTMDETYKIPEESYNKEKLPY
jgi:hypothetical protein